MLNSSSWQLLLGLFVISAHPLPEWNIGTQSSDMAFSESVPESGIINTASLAPETTDASSGFTQFPDGGNLVVSDGLISQGSSGCTPDTKRRFHRMRARNEQICPIDRLQLTNGEEKGRQILPTAPNAQQGGGGQNSGGNGEPKRRLLFPPSDDTMSYLFMPLEIRPKQDSEICPDNMHPVPVCGRPSDAYALMYSDTADLTIEPCYPYRPVLGCVPDKIGYCCLTADVTYAYDDFTESEKDLWRNLLSGDNMIRKIEQGILSGLRNPYKLVGLSCITMKMASE